MASPYFISRIALWCALSSAANLAAAQGNPAAPPGLKAAVDAAWQRSPQARALLAKREERLAGQEAAASWIAGSPVLGLSQRSDRWTEQNGLRESEISVSAPLWLPAQKSAREAFADKQSEDLEGQLLNTRLTIAGAVRERLWAVAAARAALAEARDHLQHLQAIAEDVTRRVDAGELARIDGMLAQQEALAAAARVAEAEMAGKQSLMQYRLLTGQPDAPHAEPESVADAAADPHPRLVAAQAALQRSRESLRLIHRTRSDPPTVGMALRRERDFRGGEYGNSVEIGIQIPIGTSGRNRPLETAAQTQIETAAADAEQIAAAIQGEIELARQGLAISIQGADAALARAALTRERYQLIEKAFLVGERGLVDLLRAEALAHDAEVAEKQQAVAVGLARARLNQALGILP